MPVKFTYNLKRQCGSARPFCRECTNTFKINQCGVTGCDVEPPVVICLKPTIDTSIRCEEPYCDDTSRAMIITLSPPENSVVNVGVGGPGTFPSNPDSYLLLPQYVNPIADFCTWKFEQFHDTGLEDYAPFLFTCGQMIMARKWVSREIILSLHFDGGVYGNHWEYHAGISYYFRALEANEMCGIEVGDFLGHVTSGSYADEHEFNAKTFADGDCEDGFSFSFPSIGTGDLTVLVTPAPLE